MSRNKAGLSSRLVLEVAQAAAKVATLIDETYDRSHVELGVRDGRNALVGWTVLPWGGAAMPEPRDVTYLVPTDVLAKVNTAVVVLENYGQAVTEALRQLDRTTTVAWKAVNLIEVTDDEWQLVKRTIDRGWDAAGAGSQDDIRQGLALRRLPGPQQSLLGEGGGAFRLGLPTPVGLHTVQLGRDGVLA